MEIIFKRLEADFNIAVNDLIQGLKESSLTYQELEDRLDKLRKRERFDCNVLRLILINEVANQIEKEKNSLEVKAVLK